MPRLLLRVSGLQQLQRRKTFLLVLKSSPSDRGARRNSIFASLQLIVDIRSCCSSHPSLVSKVICAHSSLLEITASPLGQFLPSTRSFSSRLCLLSERESDRIENEPQATTEGSRPNTAPRDIRSKWRTYKAERCSRSSIKSSSWTRGTM